MQARLQTNRFPNVFALLLFAIAVAGLLGGALGYALHTSSGGSGASPAIVQQGAGAATKPSVALPVTGPLVGHEDSHIPAPVAPAPAHEDSHLPGPAPVHEDSHLP
jgi:hypothetical protein